MTRVLKNSIPCRFCGVLKVPGGALVSHERSCGSGGPIKRKRSQYRELFFAHNGVGPYKCSFDCGSLVLFEEAVIHHKNGDHTDNSIDNLEAAHRLCHNGHHLRELWNDRRDDMLSGEARGHRVPHSEETKKQISDKKKSLDQKPSDEAREKARLKNLGTPRSEETKKRISNGHKARRALRAQEVMPHGE